MTIHKSQGQTLPKVVIDLGKSEKSPGCCFVAESRVRSLDHALFQPMSLERLPPKSKCKGLTFRLKGDQRLHWLAQETPKNADNNIMRKRRHQPQTTTDSRPILIRDGGILSVSTC